MSLILGIDDAGRGPLIGPMILAGVLIDKNQEPFLKKNGVTDSKLLSHPNRIELGKLIEGSCEDYYFTKLFPDEIDSSLALGINLNKLEAMKMAEVINNINTERRHKTKIKVVVDCPSVNIVAWREILLKYIKYKDNLDVHCEHKADFNHVSVSAASIIAKVEREKEVDKLKKQYKEDGELGSGYPSDPFTQAFLKKNGQKLKDSGIFRKSWATWKAIFPEKGKKQATLGDF